MTETHHASELESVMDNLEAMLEAVGVARQKVRDRQRRQVPQRAPRRPAAEPVDGVRDADVDTEREETIDGVDGAAEPWEVTEPLPPASAEVRRRMAEMAVQGRHAEQVQAAAGPEGDALLDDPVAAHRVYRAAAEEMADADSATAQQAREVLEASKHEQLVAHDAEGEVLRRELADVQRDELSRERQATLFADRIALVQEHQAAERAEQARQAQRNEREGTEFASEIRLPLTLGAAGVAGVGGSVEGVERYVEELGARVEDDELIVPVAGEGNDLEASMDPSVSAWRSVTAEELAQAAVTGEEPTNLAYLHAAAESNRADELTEASPRPWEQALVGPEGEVPVPGSLPGQIRPTEDGLVVEAAISRSGVSAAVWDQLEGEFGEVEPNSEVLLVPVSADPHADPAAEIASAREDLPRSLFAQYEEYEQQLLARQETAAAEQDSGVWVEPAEDAAYVDLVEKQRLDGSVEAMVWVDEQKRPTTHPDGVPSVWFDQEGTVAAFGHYEDGHPEGTWGWTDPESGTFASDRAEMSGDGPVPGTQQHRDSPEDGWTTVGEGSGTESSGASTGESEPSPSPGPRHDPATPPMPDSTGPSRGPRPH